MPALWPGGGRGIALERKNYLFAGADSGGDRAAAMYTIVQTEKPEFAVHRHGDYNALI